VMATVVVLLICVVQGLQSFGDWLVRRLSRK
jgi:ABC-type methionine transport system permease subunit